MNEERTGKCLHAWHIVSTGADPGFQVRVGAFKKQMRRAEGGAKMFGVIRVKNHDFTPGLFFETDKEGRLRTMISIFQL
jgi:hypothetical protein